MKKIVTKKKSSHLDSIKSEVEKVEAVDISKNDEPSWYHYVIVILVLFAIIFGIYFFSNISELNSSTLNITNVSSLSQTYIYKYVQGNITYNLQFHNLISDIDESNLTIEASKYDLLNSRNIIFSFMKYNTTDNKYITISSVKLMKFFKYFYHYKFTADDFVNFNETNCMNSTLSDKVVVFNPYSSREGVFYNRSNGCVQIDSISPERFVFVNDVFMYRLVNE